MPDTSRNSESATELEIAGVDLDAKLPLVHIYPTPNPAIGERAYCGHIRGNTALPPREVGGYGNVERCGKCVSLYGSRWRS